MRHFELHILQSVPVSCLNRDDLGSPKTGCFGGVQRARVSSQSWKRAIREYARELLPEAFKGERTKLIVEPLRNELLQFGLSSADADKAAKELAGVLSSLGKGDEKTKTLFFTSPMELQTIAKKYVELKDAKKAMKSLKPQNWNDAADIALFGRMVAGDHSLTVEGAAMFSHALSTHKVDTELDFFTAVDDKQADEEAGAGMMGILEFQAAAYYRFMALNLDLLSSHLESLKEEDRRNIVKAFVQAVIMALPRARKNSMNAATLPGYVLAVVREKGHPVQLVNAFERPVSSKESEKDGLFAASVRRLEQEYATLEKNWGMEAAARYAIPDVSLNSLLEGVAAHVR